MTSSRSRLRYVGANPITLVFPTRQITVETGDEVDLLPIEADGLAGREDFQSADAPNYAPASDPDLDAQDPDTDPDSEENHS